MVSGGALSRAAIRACPRLFQACGTIVFSERQDRIVVPNTALHPIPVTDLARQNRTVRHAIETAIGRVLKRNWYVLGREVELFEANFAKFCGVSHCVGAGNGSDAIEIALRACGVPRNARVITVANAGGYATGAILRAHAVPLLVDTSGTTMLIDLQRLASAMRADVGAIIATHLYGRMCPMPDVLRIAERHGVPVIEDCAQAHGALLDGKRAGTWGICGCFSFYPTKNLGAIGDAGAIVTSDPKLAQKLRALRNYGWTERYAVREQFGCNSRIDEIQAAVLNAKLPFLPIWNERRRQVILRYLSEFKEHGIATLERPCGPEDVGHLFVMRVNDRADVQQELARCGIGTSVHYPFPDHQQSAWIGEPWAATSLPETEASCREIISLPCFPELTHAEIRAVVKSFVRVVRCP